MNPERRDLLNLATLPARLSSEEAANFLGFKSHDIPLLTKAGLLKPLGRPMPNSDKYFATVTLNELRQDVQWLSKATIVVSQHWKEKNARKGNSAGNGDLPFNAAAAAKADRNGIAA
jgi:hypothetical protein